MYTPFIIFLAVYTICLFVFIRKLNRVEERLEAHNTTINEISEQSNEHFSAFKKIADSIGWIVRVERILENPFQVLFYGEEEQFKKILVVHKKEESVTPPRQKRVRK